MAQSTAKTSAAKTKPPDTAKETKSAAGAPLNLEQKLVEIRKSIPAMPKEKRSDGVEYSFNRIDDVYRFLTPAMNEQHVNLKITGETATRHAENGDELFYSSYTQHTRNGYDRQVWVYEADIEITWVDADNPEDRQAVTLHAIGTNDGGPDKAKGSALTYCLKYYLFEMLGIDQGADDPDNQERISERPQSQQAQQQTARQTATQNGQQGQQAQQTPRKLSEAQIGRLYRKAEDAGMSREQCLAQIQRLYRHTDPADLTREEYDTICRQLDEARASNPTA